jgi:DNA polymerase-3 subunit gamma/tau
MSLYQTHRPKKLSELVGNERTVQKIKAWADNENRSHSILLTGPSGCGKTTAARIMAKMIKCKGNDYSELDTADFRGIDTIRDLRINMNYLPMEGLSRVWLLDECHKLTNDAQNALLKSLEEPPSHAYLILATTDPDKLIKTIRTRCTMFSFEHLSEEEIILLIGEVLRKENVVLKSKVIRSIAEKSQGSPRLALSLLEQILKLDDPNTEVDVVEEQEKQSIDLCRALMSKKKWSDISVILKNIAGEPESIRQAVLGYASACLLNGDKSAYLVLDSFLERGPFFETGKARLIAACYESLFSE